jgi:hypothetical protein
MATPRVSLLRLRRAKNHKQRARTKMKRLLVTMMGSVMAIALAGGCKDKGGSGGGGGGGDMTVDQACDKSVAMMESMAKAIESNKGNCDGMGSALEKWVADNKGFMEWAKKQDGDAAKKKEFEEKCEPKVKAAMEKAMPAMMGAQECASNEKVKAAMESMQ